MNRIDDNIWEAKTWRGLQDFLFNEKDMRIDRFRSNYAYRGVYNSQYGLMTSLQRLGRQPSSFEGHLLRNFKKYTPVNTLTGSKDNIWNWMSIGQHHGLPTRLLDWTFSPNVALHFMADFEKGFDDDGAIWMVDFIEMRNLMPNELKNKIFNKGYLTYTPEELTIEVGNDLDAIDKFRRVHGDFILFIEPPSIDDRIINQFALFSTMLNPDSDMTDYLKTHPNLYKKIIVPSNLKWEIRDKLDQANISERVIYPGLEGISKWLKRWYSEKEKSKHWKL
jgi:hypothetical protein